MLSLPLIVPRNDAGFWHPSRAYPFDAANEPTSQPNAAAPHHPARRNHIHNPRSAVALLAADENTIEQRKQNVRRFGAGWIRPPGIAKTYQATMDELAEREEQEMLARREQAMMDLAAAEELEAQRLAREAAGEDGDVMEGEERDLDDEVPEAEEEEESDLDDESDMEGQEEHRDGDVTFNEDSFIEGSMMTQDVHEMLEMEEAEMAGVLQDERDLDDDIPEAGSYQHTDTELEDSSSDLGGFEAEDAPSIGGRSIRRGDRRSMLSAEGASSILGGSSLVGSSPVGRRLQGNPFRGHMRARDGN